MADNLATALVAFQKQVPTIPKGRTAQIPTKAGGSYSYKYADLSDVWEAIRKPLADNGLAVTQMLTAAGTAGYMGIKTKIWHVSGETDEAVAEFGVAGKSAQEIGSQVTYMRRYTLTSALGLDSDADDDGAAATRAKRESDDRVKEVAAAQAELLTKCKTLKIDPKQANKDFWASHGVEIRDSDADTIRAFTKTLTAPDEAASNG
jgi:hypothetical protein